MNGKELVWLPSELVEQIKGMEDELSTGTLVQKYIQNVKKDVETSIDALDDDLVNLKSFSIKVRQEFKKVYDEQVNESEKLFCDADKKLPHVKKIATKYCKELAPVKDKLEEIKQLQLSIHSWDVERIHEMISSIHEMINDEKLKPMLDFLVANFKREQ